MALHGSKVSEMAKKQLKINSASVQAPEAAPGPAEPAGTQPPLQVSVEVENPGDAPLHVWSNVRAYEYDASKKKLTVHLTQYEPQVPPEIRLLSHHPQVPQQAVVDPGARRTLNLRVPAVIRRRVPGEGMGMHFVEEAIGPVDEIEVRIQYSPEPVTAPPGENPDDLQKRLRDAGESVQSVIRVGRSKGR